jgi:hypothetical protein
LLVSYYYFKEILFNNDNNVYENMLTSLNIEIRLKHVLLVFILTVGGIFYIGRTGNYTLLPVPAWEIKLRTLLEDFLYVRPRFKAFLIGHPFLVVSLTLKERIKSSPVFYCLLILATIGQVTVINTFSHLHNYSPPL